MSTSRFSQGDIVQGDTPAQAVPFWHAPGAALYLGDVRVCLRQLPARSVHCTVTSPPYWGLRDYGTGQWEGGSADCRHKVRLNTPTDVRLSSTIEGATDTQGHQQEGYKSYCPRCGAKRTDMQIGTEPLPDCGTYGQSQCGQCFVCSIVGVMRDVHRVLRDDGTLWLNLGDSYSGPKGNIRGDMVGGGKDRGEMIYEGIGRKDNTGLPSGNLIGMPWRVALALQADGWLLRQDIIWYSPNKMPESVTNRCTKSHEHIFLLAKGDGYYYDSVAIEEPGANTGETGKRKNAGKLCREINGDTTRTRPVGRICGTDVTKNKRDVWIVPTSGYPGAHFATFSPRLITPCILAGTSEHGCCARCGRPWERIVAKSSTGQTGGEYSPPGQSPHLNARDNRDRSFEWSRNGKPGTGSTLDGIPATRETVGWRKVCGCQTNDVVPCTVLDPFVGSGTTVATAIELGRAGIGIDLSDIYLKENAIPRIEAVATSSVAKKPTTSIVHDTPPVPRKIRG